MPAGQSVKVDLLGWLAAVVQVPHGRIVLGQPANGLKPLASHVPQNCVGKGLALTDSMDAMTWIILVAALILAAGIVVYFERALRRSPFSQPSPSSTGQRNVSGEVERKAQPASVNTPAPGEVALISSALPRYETGQSQS